MATPAAGYPAAGDGRIPGPPYTPYYRTLSDSKFNPTMAVIIIVLIGACFLLGFISVFVRKCMTDETATTAATTTTTSSTTRISKNRGLEKAEVDALPIVHSTDLDEKDDTECPVCLTEFEPEDSLRLLPACKHVFHQECIDAWFDAHSTCPLCRASLTGKAVAADSSGEPVVEVSENGDSDIELQAPAEALDHAVAVPGPMISREDERSSARGTLSRNSQSFKRAVRALEAPGSKPATGRKPPSATGIRRSSSLGSDLKTLRNLLTGGDQNGSSAACALKRSRSGVPPPSSSSWFARARSMDLGARDRPSSRENWTTIDLETGKPSTVSKGESSAGSDRVWSLASLRGAMFPLSRSTSDASSSVNPHLPA